MSPRNEATRPADTGAPARTGGASPRTGSKRRRAGDLPVARGSNGARRLAQGEWLVAALATAVAVALHVVFLTHAGGLWRDEASTVHLATLPTLADVWRWLPYDHCPPMIHAAIRTWWLLGLAGSDRALRVLGLVLGLLLPAALWTASRLMRRGVPLVALSLVALNPTIVGVGDSFRGYGLGAVTAVLMLALVWRLARNPAPGTALLAAAGAVLAVQSLYQNAFLVFAACCGGILACVASRRRRNVAWIVGVGLVAALSLLPYVSIIRRSQQWYELEKAGFQWAHGWDCVSQALAFPFPAFAFVWVALGGLALALPLLAWRRGAASAADAAPRALSVFAATALAVAVAGFAIFVKVSDLPTQPWHYTPLIAFAGVTLDAVLTPSHRWARPAVLAVSAAIALAAYPIARPALETRLTNVDLLAERLSADAAAGDFVIVHPWYCGATFARYYTGRAAWSTLPPLADHFLHRYDLLKIEMQKDDAIRPVLEKAAATLQSGHRVWVLGWVPFDLAQPPAMRPAPNNPWGWFDEPYSRIWGAQAGYFILTNAQGGGIVNDGQDAGVNPLENVPLVFAAGWRGGRERKP